MATGLTMSRFHRFTARRINEGAFADHNAFALEEDKVKSLRYKMQCFGWGDAEGIASRWFVSNWSGISKLHIWNMMMNMGFWGALVLDSYGLVLFYFAWFMAAIGSSSCLHFAVET